MTRADLILALLLVWGGYWALLPWTDCIRSLPNSPWTMIQPCTFGIPTATGYWPNLLFAGVYLISAVWVVRRKRARA
jgi:hypothetical protein